MSNKLRWTLGLILAGVIFGVPTVYYRWVYTHYKRLREVTPGVLYRSGEMTADGFRDAIERFKIKTVINLQDEFPDPDLPNSLFDRTTCPESELCAEMGVRYVYNPPDLLPRPESKVRRPSAIEKFLRVMDDPANFPVLVHCKAGLNRTGIMVAVYRMEYCGWTSAQAIEEMRANGFGSYGCTMANEYLKQYLGAYKPGLRQPTEIAHRP